MFQPIVHGKVLRDELQRSLLTGQKGLHWNNDPSRFNSTTLVGDRLWSNASLVLLFTKSWIDTHTLANSRTDTCLADALTCTQICAMWYFLILKRENTCGRRRDCFTCSTMTAGNFDVAQADGCNATSRLAFCWAWYLYRHGQEINEFDKIPG